MALTNAQLVDVRRFMGYQALGATSTANDPVYNNSVTLSAFLDAISSEEEDVIVDTYLTNLTVLENAIVAASANLDTDQAAVWTHNKNEVRDRERLFNSWRARLCGFLGFPCGAGINSSSTISLVRS